MAVVTTKSAGITNRDAGTMNDPAYGNLVKRVASGVVAIANGDSATSKLIVCSVPSNARVLSVKVSAPDIGTTTTADVGIYRTTLDGSAVVDADLFASALSLSGGAINKTECVNESTVIGVDEMEKPLWEAAGASTDPKCDYDVVLTLVGAADAAGSVFVEVEFVL
jgi:hypothetical protein